LLEWFSADGAIIFERLLESQKADLMVSVADIAERNAGEIAATSGNPPQGVKDALLKHARLCIVLEEFRALENIVTKAEKERSTIEQTETINITTK